MRMFAMMLWTVTLRLSPPVYKLGGREFCVVFSCVVLGYTVRTMSSHGAPSGEPVRIPLSGVKGVPQLHLIGNE